MSVNAALENVSVLNHPKKQQTIKNRVLHQSAMKNVNFSN